MNTNLIGIIQNNNDDIEEKVKDLNLMSKGEQQKQFLMLLFISSNLKFWSWSSKKIDN